MKENDRLSALNGQFKAKCEGQWTFWENLKRGSSPVAGGRHIWKPDTRLARKSGRVSEQAEFSVPEVWKGNLWAFSREHIKSPDCPQPFGPEDRHSTMWRIESPSSLFKDNADTSNEMMPVFLKVCLHFLVGFKSITRVRCTVSKC